MNTINSNIKKIALSLLVVGLAVGTQAFKNAEKVNKSKFANEWFELKEGVAITHENAIEPENYELVGSEPCSNGSTYCGVLADEVSGEPKLNPGQAARTQIDAYFTTSVEGALISARN